MNRRCNLGHASVDSEGVGHGDIVITGLSGRRGMLHRLRLHGEIPARSHTLARRHVIIARLSGSRCAMDRLGLHRKVSSRGHAHGRGQVVVAGLSRGQGAMDRGGDLGHASGDGQGVGHGDIIAGFNGRGSCLMNGLHGLVARDRVRCLQDRVIVAGLGGSVCRVPGSVGNGLNSLQAAIRRRGSRSFCAMRVSTMLRDNVIYCLCNIVLAGHRGRDCRVSADIDSNINHLRRDIDAHSRALQGRCLLANR